MHFLLSTMSVVYVLNTPIPDDGDDATVEQVRRRNKWVNDDYVCHGIILNGMSDSLFDIYQNVESEKELWDSFEAKYMADDASSKKFLISNFTNYKMTNSRLVMEQYHELLGILGRFTQHKMNIDEAIQVSCIIDKLSPSWKDFKHTLKHKKEELTLIELDSHLRIEESLKVHDSDKPKSKNVLVLQLSICCWKCGKPGHLKKDYKGGKVGNKANGLGTNGLVNGSSNSLKGHNMFNKSFLVYYVTYVSEAYFVQDDNVAWTKSRVLGVVVRLPDLKLKTLGERGIKCIFVEYAEHSKAFWFYNIEPNESVLINSIIESKDAIFDENIFSSVPRPSQRFMINGTVDIGGSMVPEEITEEVVVQQPELKLRKSNMNKNPKNFDPQFQLYLIEGIRDEDSNQHSNYFNVKDDPKTFDEAMKSKNVAFWKEAINDEMDSIMGNNTWVLADPPPSCKHLGCKWIFKRKLKVDGTIEKFKARLVI
ncbi:zinc finger, CCHC-type containing protein [Tanacetum coccineum]|uniref:Zinc finger, CCHC-type containing protein n=1 Tax=Tanacetum coccineum TaxID=301880 RepID=A0ABQ5C5I2_9ASTR